MGKVIKGSAASAERYTVPIPVIAAPQAPLEPEPFGGDGSASFAEFDRPIGAFAQAASAPPAPEVPPEPAIDFEAIAAQAQELIDDAARSAQTLVDEGHERARVLIDEANATAANVVETARRGAFDEGYAAGTRAAHAEMEAMLATMRELLESTRAERHTLLRVAESELVRLAVGIAERVLHQQIALDPGVVVEMAKAAIARTVDRERITVRVNPGDVARMREHRDDLLALGDVKTMRVIEDQRVDRGGVVVETDAGTIDAKIGTQLAEARKILHIVDDVIVQPAGAAPLDDTALDARAS